ncbi:hypothetical protein JNUCC74_09130 [Cerasibacillus sp. JNUCC 74]
MRVVGVFYPYKRQYRFTVIKFGDDMKIIYSKREIRKKYFSLLTKDAVTKDGSNHNIVK